MKALFNNTVYFSEMISENMPHSVLLIFLFCFFQAMKTYHTYQTESMQAESKLRAMELQKNKLEQQLAGKNISSNRKLKTFTRQTEKVGSSHVVTDM